MNEHTTPEVLAELVTTQDQLVKVTGQLAEAQERILALENREPIVYLSGGVVQHQVGGVTVIDYDIEGSSPDDDICTCREGDIDADHWHY